MIDRAQTLEFRVARVERPIWFAGLVAVAIWSVCLAQAQTSSLSAPVARLGFGSLMTDRVDVRATPGFDKTVTLQFKRAGLPIAVLEDGKGWLRVQDADGATGWVAADLVSKRRTALIIANPGETISVRGSERAEAEAIAILEPGVIVGIVSCDGRVCRISTVGNRGYVDQTRLWGVADGEVLR